jgi:hypothetical protein
MLRVDVCIAIHTADTQLPKAVLLQYTVVAVLLLVINHVCAVLHASVVAYELVD